MLTGLNAVFLITRKEEVLDKARIRKLYSYNAGAAAAKLRLEKPMAPLEAWSRG
jgi:hypothetical protein